MVEFLKKTPTKIEEHSMDLEDVKKIKNDIIIKIQKLKSNNVNPKVIVMPQDTYYYLKALFKTSDEYGLGLSVTAYFQKMGIKMVVHNPLIEEVEVF